MKERKLSGRVVMELKKEQPSGLLDHIRQRFADPLVDRTGLPQRLGLNANDLFEKVKRDSTKLLRRELP